MAEFFVKMKRETNPKLAAIWKHTHNDYKGVTGGMRCILVLREGGTTSVPLSCLTEKEIADRLPRDFKS